MAIRLSLEMRQRIDAWSAKGADKPGRSEAIRRLLGLGLGLDQAVHPGSKGTKNADKASEMAGSMIDFLSDKSASPELRAKQKRRLVEGPSEFREMRTDRSKPKR
jgi:hypothetical protein